MSKNNYEIDLYLGSFCKPYRKMSNDDNDDCRHIYGYKDGEFDFYTYSLPSTGGYMINGIQIGDNKDKVRAIATDGIENTCFEIKDNAGFIYNLGKADSSKDYTERALWGDFYWITSWLLSQIKSPYNTNEIINFEYNQYDFYDWNETFINQNNNVVINDTPVLKTPTYDIPGYDMAPARTINKGSAFYKQMCYLKGIKGLKETIRFIRESTGNPELQKIEIYDLNNNLIKQITFNYIKRNNNPAVISHRLLNSISIKGNNSSEEQIYSFDYYHSNLNSFISDQWGYYKRVNSIRTYEDLFIHKEFAKDQINNHKRSTTRTSLDLVIDFDLFDRSTIDVVPFYFSLKRIKYPTGGYTEYEYESNEVKVRDYPFNKKKVGGQRIKKITSKTDNDIMAKVTEYKYGENENGTGYCDINLNFQFFADESSTYNRRYVNSGDITTIQPLRYYCTSPLLPELNNLPVIYKEVAIYEHDANDKMKNGKTIVKYDYKPKYKLGSFYQRANGLTNNLSNYRGLYYIENYNLNAKPFIHSKDIIRNNGDTLMSEIFHYEKSDSISFKGLKVKRNVSSNCLISYDDSQPPYIYDLISAKYEYAYYTINASVDLLKSKKNSFL